jgi:hypothetical protein
MYTGSVYIENLRSGSGTFRLNFNGNTNITVDRKHWGRPFSFGETVFKTCSSFNWNETGGWL